MILSSLMLAVALAAYLFFLRGDLQSWPIVARWLYAGTRAQFYALWCARALVLFGGVSLVSLVVIGGLPTLAGFPTLFVPVRDRIVALVGDGRDFPLWWMIGALFGGGVIGGIVDRIRRGRRPWMLGDISRVIPRHRRELVWGVALSLVAGTTEELFFRLLLPLLVTAAIGQPLIGFAVGIALFAGAHRYQGWIGVGATAFVGALMTTLYLVSGALWVAMLVHVVIDLNGLVLRPIMAGVLSSSAATRS